MLKNGIKIFAGLMILAGSIFTLQGFNILLGSFMSGDPQWIINGIIIIIIGVILFWFANRK